MKKHFIAGALFGAIVASSTVSAATPEIANAVQAVFAEFNLVVDGEEKQIKKDPLIVDGTAYYPIREMSELLGYNLEWQEDTRTIQLTNVTTAVYGYPLYIQGSDGTVRYYPAPTPTPQP